MRVDGVGLMLLEALRGAAAAVPTEYADAVAHLTHHIEEAAVVAEGDVARTRSGRHRCRHAVLGQTPVCEAVAQDAVVAEVAGQHIAAARCEHCRVDVGRRLVGHERTARRAFELLVQRTDGAVGLDGEGAEAAAGVVGREQQSALYGYVAGVGAERGLAVEQHHVAGGNVVADGADAAPGLTRLVDAIDEAAVG